jgi:hypothetical protein
MASETITALSLTQSVAGSVSVSFTATDALNSALVYTYQWKLSSSSTWAKATTTLPSTGTAASGGTAVSGVWNLDADYIGPLTSGAFDFQVTALRAPLYATGSVTAIAANASSGLSAHDTLTIGSIYEFTVDGTFTAGHVPVHLATASDAASVVETELIAAITTDPAATVNAVAGTGTTINLTAKTAGTAGNVAITQSISHSATFTPVGMQNGAAETDVVASNLSSTWNTGSLGEPGDSLIVGPGGNTQEINEYDRFGKHPVGTLPQQYLKKYLIYKILDQFVAGKRSLFTFVNNYSQTTPKLAGTSSTQRRAVLISTAEWTRTNGGTTLKIAPHSRQRLANYAYKAITNYALFAPAPIVSVYKDTIVNGAVVKTTVAYFMSAATYDSLAD